MTFAVSCDKNDDDNDNNQQSQTNDTSLVGTNWASHDEGENELESGIMAHYVADGRISFETANSGSFSISMEYEEYPEENMNYELPITYTYKAPNGTITVSMMGFTRNMTFVVSGDQMTLTSTYDGETETSIFTKQS